MSEHRCRECDKGIAWAGGHPHRRRVYRGERAAMGIPGGLEQNSTSGTHYIMDARQVVGNCALWWRPEGAGYTTQLNEAGLYPADYSCRKTDILVPKEVAERFVVQHVLIDQLRAELSRV